MPSAVALGSKFLSSNMAKFIIADTHFFHENIIDYCDRPFKDWQEMNAVMIERWNEVVTPEDEVYHLGDCIF